MALVRDLRGEVTTHDPGNSIYVVTIVAGGGGISSLQLTATGEAQSELPLGAKVRVRVDGGTSS
jgi:hypothetical protein